MELRDQMKSDWSPYCQPATEFDHCSELNGSYMRPEDDSEPYCNIWTDAEPARVPTCSGHSFAMEARIRLDNLKSGCNPSSPRCGTKRMLFNYDSEKDLWDSEESALDMVDILDVEDDVHDEESWLYELPRKSVEEKESALKWCRHVLDNPSPEVEAARHALLNTLDQKSRRHVYRQPAVYHQAADVPLGSSSDMSDNSTHPTSGRLGNVFITDSGA
ncbi:SLAIN motif-containing protein 2-like [Salarias fasciatus]|uniref:SLAIN motif-containing protein 2-like n=1 Tax=Salarias fasciatus TaxID=181472 RepID=UPI0011766293|nr:SLAIN motif-containing protein 2-like [Salarias fasciatus]